MKDESGGGRMTNRNNKNVYRDIAVEEGAMYKIRCQREERQSVLYDESGDSADGLQLLEEQCDDATCSPSSK